MRLIGARQAWHDAYHDSTPSTLEVAAAKAELGKRGRVANETFPSRQETNSRCAHMLASGLVQKAIASLPRPVQHFGHYLYSPIATGQDLNIAHALVWFTTQLEEMTQRRQAVAYWIALAALQSHRAMVHGREGWGPARVAAFVQDWSGVRLDPGNWARDWAGVWEALASSVDALDAKALAPVAAVIRAKKGAA